MTAHHHPPPPPSPTLSSSFSRSLSLSSSSSPFSSPSSSSLCDNAAFVPFLWETKPGISKGHTERKKMQESSSFRRTVVVSSDAFSPSRKPLPPPPCLQQVSRTRDSNFQRDNVLSGSSHHRKIKSRDDPFLLAMEACKKAERKASNPETPRVVAKLRKKKDFYGSLLGQEKQAIAKMIRSSSYKSSVRGKDPDSLALAQKGVENSTGHNNRPNGSRISRRKSCTEGEVCKGAKEDKAARRCATELFCRSLSKTRFASVRNQSSQSVHLSCGQYRKAIAALANKQTITDWFGCRNGQSFSVIHPSRN